jgi:hypothetical protein
MGTSASNLGPSKDTPLLPPWAPDQIPPKIPPFPPNQDLPIPEKEIPDKEKEELTKIEPKQLNSGDWQAPRRNLTRYINNPTRSNLKNAVKSYIRASGGSRSISRSAISGKGTAVKLGGFLSNISTIGTQTTLKQLNLGELEGISAELAINRIVAALSPPGGTIEESVAQAALLNTMEKLYIDLEMQKNGINALDKITIEYSIVLLDYYVCSYVYNRWLHELWSKAEGKDISPTKIIQYEKEIENFIRESVKYELGKIDLSNKKIFNKKIENIIEELFQTCYNTLEVL